MISVGLDLGNSKISCIVCDINSQGKVKPLSFVSRPSKGIKKNGGNINDVIEPNINKCK